MWLQQWCDTEAAQPYFAEAISCAINDEWTLGQIDYWQVVRIFLQVSQFLCELRPEQARELADSIETGSSPSMPCLPAWRRYGKATRTEHWHYLATLPPRPRWQTMSLP